jgi:glycosyltransferase involved in cell wall biosynthesis
MMGSLKTQAKALGITEKMIWLGERDAREVFSGFDLFALASRKEGLPYVVLEAMSAGLPVIATFSSGVEILVDQDVNGIVVPTDNVAEFAEALKRVLQSPELLSRFGAASKTLVGRFTIDKMVDETLRSYRLSLQPSVGSETARASMQ